MTLGPRQQLLVDSLMSGDYKREEGLFHTVNSKTGTCAYCAAGLAMETARVNGAKFSVYMNGIEDHDYTDYEVYDFPHVAWDITCKWYGMHDWTLYEIVKLNDGEHMSFRQLGKLMLKDPARFFKKAK